MRRYGRDHGYRFAEGPGRYDRYDYRSGFRGARSFERPYLGGPSAGGWDEYPEGPGWGYSGVREPTRDLGGTPMGRDWETGEPWGGRGDADRVRAGDLMTANPEAVTPDTPLSEVAARMRDLDVGIIPIVDNETDHRLLGVITDRDIAVRAAAEGKNMKQARAGDYMTERVQTVRENDHVRDVFSVMKRERVRRVPVTDEDGRLVGIIAQADLAVDYAGVDLERETEVEEVIERISEPARPTWDREWRGPRTRRRYVAGGPGYDDWARGGHPLGERLRHGWSTLKREARHLLDRGYDRGWRR